MENVQLADDDTEILWRVVSIPASDAMWPTSADLTLLLLCPVLGDAAALLLQRMATVDEGIVAPVDVAYEWNVDIETVMDALDTLCEAGFARVVRDEVLVPTRIGPLSGCTYDLLPRRLRALHDSLSGHHDLFVPQSGPATGR